MHDLLYYIKLRTNAKVVLFHCDDLVTFRQYSYSPLFWINRILLRNKMNKSIKLADQNYCIIDEQLRIYRSIYNLDFKLLYKTGQFISMPNPIKQSLPLKFVYTGNIICGRIKSLIEIANVLKKINRNEIKVILYIYTANVISAQDYNLLINNKFVKIMGKVPYDEIPKILTNSDVLIHVESFEIKHKLITSLSFSTKLVDYFEVAKPILALGWENASSIKYLDENNIGFTVKKTKDLYFKINYILNNLEELDFIGEKTWKFGQLHHNESGILQKFQEDLIKMR